MAPPGVYAQGWPSTFQLLQEAPPPGGSQVPPRSQRGFRPEGASHVDADALKAWAPGTAGAGIDRR